ncbi:uncharacterized protein EbC_pEb17200930 (plasmid) [Erwinia billingiae Eb661]|uniref:Uncharacterized protein n=1 Tax=Erwinia billingiae (strain Eb661) TaxID=634500 RepID=D8MJU8_ERWBE|nr:uncharacterized protein EbC_pEb17200930 [Erwinia billingiae Eb661]
MARISASQGALTAGAGTTLLKRLRTGPSRVGKWAVISAELSD